MNISDYITECVPDRLAARVPSALIFSDEHGAPEVIFDRIRTAASAHLTNCPNGMNVEYTVSLRDPGMTTFEVWAA